MKGDSFKANNVLISEEEPYIFVTFGAVPF